MSKLEDLIANLCPDGVEYKKVAEVVEVERGRRVVRGQLSQDSGFPVFQNCLTSMGFHSEYNYPAGTTFVIGAGAAGEIGYSDVNFWAADDCYPLRSNNRIISRFLYHLLLSKKQEIAGKVRRASIPRLSRESIGNLLIPVPPLPVQEEIVRILDKFTALAQELAQELALRKKQYEYYQVQILDFTKSKLIDKLCPKCVEFRKVKEVYTRIKGTPITAGKMKEISCDDGNIRIFAGGKTVVNAKEGDIPKANITRAPSVLVQSRGIIDFIFYDRPFTFKNEMWAYTHKNPTTVKFLYYVLRNNVLSFREVASAMGTFPQISLPVTDDFIIPVPSLSVQEEIVRVLDKFSELTTDLSSGLPAEIAARQKQYEYYRDQLLTFPIKGS